MATTPRTAPPMAGPTGRGLPRRQLPPTTTKADKKMPLVLLGCANARWPPLVPMEPPAKEQEPPEAAWTVVALRGCRSKLRSPPPASAVEHCNLTSLPSHQDHQASTPPPEITVEQATLHYTPTTQRLPTHVHEIPARILPKGVKHAPKTHTKPTQQSNQPIVTPLVTRKSPSSTS